MQDLLGVAFCLNFMKTISLSNFKVRLRPPLLSNLTCSVTVACIEDRGGSGGVPGARLLLVCWLAVQQLSLNWALINVL